MHRNLLLWRHFSGWAAHWRRLLLFIVTTMMMAVAMGAEPEPPEKGGPTEASSLSEFDDQVQETGTGNEGVPGLLKSKGAFARLWNQQSFVGPGVLALPGSHQAPKLRLPGDFEKHEALVLAGGWLAQKAPKVLRDIVIQTKSRMRLVLLVASSRERDLARGVLAERGVPPDTIRFVTVPMDTGWVHDFGPVFVCEAGGGFRAVDAAYDRPGRERDDAATRAIADQFQGGSTLSNGQGLLVTTTQSINANIECGYDAETAACFLRGRLGVEQVIVLEPLVGEGTGHIDMYACFTSPDTILVGEYDESVDPQNAAALDRNAARLAEVHTSRGKLKVIRVGMPTNQDGVWRSFTNVVFANGTLLVPIYPDVDPSGGEEALATYRRLLPGWKVFGVDVSTMARHQGGLRCVTLYVPEAGQRRRNSTATGPHPDAGR